MRVEFLSDHCGEQLSASEQAVQQAETGLAFCQGLYIEAHSELQEALRAKPEWKRMLSVPTPKEQEALAHVHNARREVDLAHDGLGHAHSRVRQRAAGLHGEEMLTLGLSSLSDEWIMLRGYRNRRGETDVVLVGPDGVWAVEVKRRRVRLNALGDEWWYEKLDARGNVVDTGPAVDGRGRSWARQVNDVASGLTSWLWRKGQRVWVRTAVMLMHEQAQIGECGYLPVDLVGTHPRHLMDAIAHSASPLCVKRCTEIVGLVRRDHDYHQSRRTHS